MEQIPNKISSSTNESNESNELFNDLCNNFSNDRLILDGIHDERVRHALENKFISFNEGIKQEVSSLIESLNNDKRLFVETTLATIDRLVVETTKVMNNNGKKVCLRMSTKDKDTKTKFSESNENKFYPNDISYGINLFKEMMREKGYDVNINIELKRSYSSHNYDDERTGGFGSVPGYIYVVSFDL